MHWLESPVTTTENTFCFHSYLYSNSVRLSVRLSVRDVLVFDENGLTYCHSFFHHGIAQSF